MPSEPGRQPSAGRNPFVPEDLSAMTPEHRRSYTAHLIAVRQKLTNLVRASNDGASIEAIVEEVDAALGVLRAQDGSTADRQQDETHPH